MAVVLLLQVKDKERVVPGANLLNVPSPSHTCLSPRKDKAWSPFMTDVGQDARGEGQGEGRRDD